MLRSLVGSEMCIRDRATLMPGTSGFPEARSAALAWWELADLLPSVRAEPNQVASRVSLAAKREMQRIWRQETARRDGERGSTGEMEARVERLVEQVRSYKRALHNSTARQKGFGVRLMCRRLGSLVQREVAQRCIRRWMADCAFDASSMHVSGM
eukprot:TRINITY_DN37838_c0_g1_i1.p2 TRINITY_DN37838_c0_g1~~TRINITY_DN37838_c0_g1_i1.p2  ORF type:complete len:155 (+),score=35.28 TRINITY_DN37838_c0_g1_i1:97-561(+)